jgi:predicted kinase
VSLPEGVLLSQGSRLLDALERLARDARCVFFAGLPGTGKSLLIHQLAHLAHARDRRIHLLQWDVARPVFEASPAARRYPQEHGITHPLIRVAVGRWARPALAAWDAAQPATAMLIGETPFVGHRFIDLARPADDAAEAVLVRPTTRFVIVVPSAALRRHLEAERARRAEAPVHPREREDAPPDVLRDVWRELAGAAKALGVADVVGDATYDPGVYRAVYARLLARRHAEALDLDERLPVRGMSAYEFRIPTVELAPSDDETARFIAGVEGAFADAAALQHETARWFQPYDVTPALRTPRPPDVSP